CRRRRPDPKRNRARARGRAPGGRRPRASCRTSACRPSSRRAARTTCASARGGGRGRGSARRPVAAARARPPARAARRGRGSMTAPQMPNLFKVPELKEKILFTLLCLLIYRIGAHIATPGVNVQALQDFVKNSQGTLFALYDLFAGGGFSRATVFALGIMPYISASIVFQ